MGRSVYFFGVDKCQCFSHDREYPKREKSESEVQTLGTEGTEVCPKG